MVASRPASLGYSLVSRVLDVLVALPLALLTLPLVLLILAAVRLESPGAPLLCQDRIGRDGRVFGMYKVRSMRQGAPADLVKTRECGYTTAFGRILRRHSLDELPQLWNVLKGDMALVGPRPEVLSNLGDYAPADFHRFDVLPGLTGLWQVSGRSELSLREKIELDLQYVEARSLSVDLRILVRTPLAVLRCRGAF